MGYVFAGLLLFVVPLVFGGVVAGLALPHSPVMGPACAIVIGIALSVLIFKLVRRQKQSILTVSEFSERYPREWQELNGKIQDGDTILCSETSRLSWRLLCGHRSLCVMRKGVKVYSYVAMN